MLSSLVVTCVSYHHFEQTPSPYTRHLGVSTSPAAFARHLAYFKRHYSPISLDQLIAGDLPPNPLLLTIDDAYRSVLDIAAPLLSEHRIPALLTTNPGVIAGGFAPIDNVLSLAMEELGATGLGLAVGLTEPWSGSIRRVVREILPTLDLCRRAGLKERLLRLLGVEESHLVERMDLFLNPDQLARLVTEHGFTVGNHTVSHTTFRGLPRSQAQTEILGGKRQLEQMTGQNIRSFSFPYGNRLDATPDALEILRASGHEAIFLVQRRTNAVRPSPDIWYRQSMADDTELQLDMKLTWYPRMGELKAALN